MPAVLILGFALFVILAAIALTPLMLVQRYRVGTARRRARVWSSTVNIVGIKRHRAPEPENECDNTSRDRSLGDVDQDEDGRGRLRCCSF
jgi:hypothetical protein